MANPNRQRVESGHLIIVTLVPGQNRADVSVRRPDGGGIHPRSVDLTPFINAGISETDALDRVMDIVVIGVQSTFVGNG